MKRKKTARPTVVSFFSGCGGLDLGFEQCDFDIRQAFDVDVDAIKTYNENLGSVALNVDLSSHIPHVGPVDVLLAGAPCQGFSMAGKRDALDPRNQLLLRIPALVKANNPQVVVVENVPGVRSGLMNAFWNQLVGELQSQGYKTTIDEFSAVEVGAAQLRKRVFLICWRGPAMPAIIPRSADRKTLREALHDIPADAANHDANSLVLDCKTKMIARRIGPGQKLSNVRGGPRSVHTWEIPEVFGCTSELDKQLLANLLRLRRQLRKRAYGDADPVEISVLEQEMGVHFLRPAIDKLVQRSFLERHGENHVDLRHTFNGLYRRLEWAQPSYTVDTRFCSARHFLHPSEHRGFTAREAARIQGFQDDFVFQGSAASIRRMIGNAVSPVVSLAIAKMVRNHFFRL